MRWRTAVLAAATAALTLAGIAPAIAAEPSGTSWTADLASGEAAGVTTSGGAVRLDPATAFRAPADAPAGEALTEGAADLVSTGLLTLAPQDLNTPTSAVESVLDATVPPGSSASMDVRGRTATGGWTEWIPSSDAGVAELPTRTSEVQGRLVVTGDATVRGATLRAEPSTGGVEGLTEQAPLSYNVFATREGLVGGTTANGHVITERDHFVALPSRRALSPRDTSDYSVRVCAPNGQCAFAPVWDVGPWNTRDDYWNSADQRQEWKDLPQGVPQAQAAYRDGYNGGNDQFGRKAANPAGIDLGDGVFWDALGLKDNSQVQVDYLWTGSVRLSKVSAEGVAQVRSAPSDDASVVGVAADSADVPVECVSAGWARIGEGQFLTASVLPEATDAPSCAAAGDAVAGGAAAPGEEPTHAAAAAPGSAGSGSDAAGNAASDAAPTASGSVGEGASVVGAGGRADAGGAGASGAGSGGAGASDAGSGGAGASGAGAADPADTGPVTAPSSAEVGGAAAVRAGAATVEQPTATG
ncbi:hypothetical protein [Pseudonocardia oroxyli]|nr:hypothetical protein [Pseudonocardia oroxyli]